MINLDIGKIAGSLIGGGADAIGGAAGALGGITKALDPLGSVVDTLGSALGLPPAVTNAAKIGIGAATGNPMMIANGALGVVQDVAREVPAMTEMFDGHLSAGIDARGRGYVKGDFEGPGGKLSFDFLGASLFNPFLSSPSFFMKIGFGDSCKGGVDNHRPPEHQAPHGTSPARPPPPPGSSAPTGNASEQGYLRALETLSHNWGAMIDGSKYVNSHTDQKLDAAELHRLTRHPNPEIANAANLVLSNPQMRERLFNAHGDGRTITLGEVRSEIHRIRTDMEMGKTPAQTGGVDSSRPTPPPGRGVEEGSRTEGTDKAQGPSKFAAIINDPHLSLEDKIMMILSQIMDELDDEILDTMKDLDKSKEKAAKEKDPTKKAAGDSTAQKTELHLQNLMEKRKRMFDLMTNISAKFNEMAKAAIQNLARA